MCRSNQEPRCFAECTGITIIPLTHTFDSFLLVAIIRNSVLSSSHIKLSLVIQEQTSAMKFSIASSASASHAPSNGSNSKHKCRKPLKIQPIFKKCDHFENWQKWPPCKGYIAFGKWSIWVKNKNCKKHARNDYPNTSNLIYAENSSRNQLIFEKWDHFENWQQKL